MNTNFRHGLYKAPIIGKFKIGSMLYDKNVYFIKSYEPGFIMSVSLGFDVDANIQFADWDGNVITDIQDQHIETMCINESFIPIASMSHIDRYQMFFNSELEMVDFIEPVGHFVSPGMLIQLFSKSKFKTQNILGKGVLNEKSISEMLSKYNACILKPSVKMIIDQDKTRPLYERI